MLAAESGMVMLAEIGMKRALYAGKPQPEEPRRKRAKAYNIVG